MNLKQEFDKVVEEIDQLEKTASGDVKSAVTNLKTKMSGLSNRSAQYIVAHPYAVYAVISATFVLGVVVGHYG